MPRSGSLAARRLARAGLILALSGSGLSAARAEEVQPTLNARLDAGLEALSAEAADPDAARALVAARTALEAYEGVQKGARGAYLTGGGNSLDQALLLEDLIRRRSPEARLRFAACELGDAEGLAAWSAVAARAASPGAAERGAALAAAIADPELRAAVTAALGLHAEAAKEQSETAAYLAGGLAAADYAPLDAAAAGVAALRHHVWLQADLGGAWQDLDTTTADGAAPCAAAETYEALPDSAFRTLRIRLIVERRSDGVLAEETLLDSTMNVADLATARVAFGFGEAMGLLPPGEADAARAAYTPVLRVDNVSVEGVPLDLPPPVKDAAVGLADAIDAIGEDEPADAGAGDGVTGAVLDFTFGGPGAPVRLTSAVFDRLGPAARRGEEAATAVLAPLEVAGGDYAAITALWQIAVTAGAARGEAALPEGELDLTTLDGLSAAFDGMLRLFPALREELGGGTGNGASILIGGLTPFRTEDGAAGFRVVLDALHVPAFAGADAAAAAADAAAIPAAEHLLAALAGEALSRADNAGSVLAVARAAQKALVKLADGQAEVGGASADALARMAEDIAAGRAVLAPERAVMMDGRAVLAWWTIDLQTGLVRDRHENGRHSETVEYETTNTPGLTAADRFRRFACTIVRPLALAGAIIFAASGGTAGTDIVKAAAKIATAADETRKKGQAATKIACMGQGGQGAP